MGFMISKLLDTFKSKKEIRILMLGLDGAGKTTILYKLKVGEVISTIPTIGFNVETVQYKNINFTVWDIGGQEKIRNLWRCYYPNTSGIVFVVDASDTLRIETAKEELHTVMAHYELPNAALLVFANKQDMPNAVDCTELAKLMDLQSLKQKWHIHGTCATKGNGLYEGLDNLKQMIDLNSKK